jgi:hypothetical protein
MPHCTEALASRRLEFGHLGRQLPADEIRLRMPPPRPQISISMADCAPLQESIGTTVKYAG